MNCPRHIEASAYIDNMLSAAERREFDLHLQRCTVCQQRIEDLAVLRQRLCALPSPAPAGIDIAVLIETRIRALPVPFPQKRPFWIHWGAPGLAIAASVVSGIWIGGLLGTSAVTAGPAMMVRVFDPIPPGGLCAVTELCRASKEMP